MPRAVDGGSRLGGDQRVGGYRAVRMHRPGREGSERARGRAWRSRPVGRRLRTRSARGRRCAQLSCRGSLAAGRAAFRRVSGICGMGPILDDVVRTCPKPRFTVSGRRQPERTTFRPSDHGCYGRFVTPVPGASTSPRPRTSGSMGPWVPSRRSTRSRRPRRPAGQCPVCRRSHSPSSRRRGRHQCCLP